MTDGRWTFSLPVAAVLPQPRSDVLQIDDRVVDHGAQGDHQAGERHRVDVASTPVQHQQRRHQRQRDGHQADHRDPPLVEEGNQDHERPAGSRAAAPRLRLWIDVLMKLACRKILVSKTTSGRPGCSDLITSSTSLGDVESVAPRQLLDDQQQTRAVVDDRVADERLVVILDVGHLTRAARGRRSCCRP